jgi:CRISPR-associated protein Cst2
VDKFAKELIQEYQEFDLFGGLLTNLKGADGKKVELSYGDSVKRTAPVKITYAYSISKFQGDMDFMNNIEAYNRYIRHIEQKDAQVITQSEQHTSHYYYTIAIDLDRIGVWETENRTEDVIPAEEKAKRVKDLLDIIRTLSRQIRGRYENLSPIFVIGGIYKVKNPFFMGCISAKETEDGKLLLDINRLLDCKGIIPEEERDSTLCGLLSGFFANEQEIREKLNCKSVGEVFEELKNKVGEIYGVPKG